MQILYLFVFFFLSPKTRSFSLITFQDGQKKSITFHSEMCFYKVVDCSAG